MKRIFILLTMATLAGGCATESFLNDDGTRNWRGHALWMARDVVGWEAEGEVDETIRQ